MKTHFPAALLYEGKRWFSGIPIPVTLYGKPSSPNIIIKTEEKKKDFKKYRIPELEVQIVHDWLKIVPLPWKLHICSTKVS